MKAVGNTHPLNLVGTDEQIKLALYKGAVLKGFNRFGEPVRLKFNPFGYSLSVLNGGKEYKQFKRALDQFKNEAVFGVTLR